MQDLGIVMPVELLWEHVAGFLVAEEDLVDGVTAVLERCVFAVDVGGEEDLWGGVSGEDGRPMRGTYLDSRQSLGWRRGRRSSRVSCVCRCISGQLYVPNAEDHRAPQC